MATRREFDRLVGILEPMRVLSPAYVDVVEVAAQALADHWSLIAFLRGKGRTYTATSQRGTEMIRVRPEVAELARLRRDLKGLLEQLGLTPAAVSKVSTLGAAPAQDPVARFRAARPVARIDSP
jgi:phage terminase small subunit